MKRNEIETYGAEESNIVVKRETLCNTDGLYNDTYILIGSVVLLPKQKNAQRGGY